MMLLREQAPSVSLVELDEARGTLLGHAFAQIDPWVQYGFPADALGRYLGATDTDAIRHAILVGEELAGAVIVRPSWLRGPYLQFLGVLPPYQRRGVGHCILDWMVQDAVRGDQGNLWVVASSFNGNALAFYGRHGFRPVGVLDGLITRGIDEILLRKTLD